MHFPRIWRPLPGILFLQLWILMQGSAAGSLPAFDFTDPQVTRQWAGPHDCSLAPASAAGLPVRIIGDDPYFHGPPRDYPSKLPLWLKIRLTSESGGSAQVFFHTQGATEENSVRFFVRAGAEREIRVPLPALGPGFRLRLDPPGTRGTCTIRSIAFEPRIEIAQPEWPRPIPLPARTDRPTAQVKSGPLELVFRGHATGSFEIRVSGTRTAQGLSQPVLGYLQDSNARWFAWPTTASPSADSDGIRIESAATDPDGANWKWVQKFRPSNRPGGIDVEVSLQVNRDRNLVFAPLLVLFPGLGTHGTNKTQATLAGVEYLENEESSSERDLIGPQALRRVPDSLKLTFPLMSLAHGGRWLAVLWEPQPGVAALFDSPDRVFHSGGSLMGIIAPGSDGTTRPDGAVLPYDGLRLAANAPLVLRATILGGVGATVVPSVQEYVARRGLPPIPATGYDAPAYFRLAAHGWLDSALRNGTLFGHAVGPTFTKQPAADAALWMDWLAPRVEDVALATRLREAARAAIATIAPASQPFQQVGHIPVRLPGLVYGEVAANLEARRRQGLDIARRFQADGGLPFSGPGGNRDLGSTHWSREASGLASTMVARVLADALATGDPELRREGIRLLEGLDRFHEGVPRGAQTWEVPLHTPDILGSAYLCESYLLGFELTGEPRYLAEAKYWAWTGVPFVYLHPPTDQPVGVYSTTPVLGATQFVAPNWIGLPVQWCGLVYAAAIQRLARYDLQGPWIRLAEGIAAAGIQHTHAADEPDKQGLLPDSYDLRSQYRNPVPINPATLLAVTASTVGRAPMEDFLSLRTRGWIVHAPGTIQLLEDSKDSVKLRVAGWPAGPWWLLVNGVAGAPMLKLNGRDTPIQPPHLHNPTRGWLLIQCEGTVEVELR